MYFSQIVPVLVGGMLAILGSVVATLTVHWITIRHQRRSLSQAFAGEIGAILDIINRRHYLRDLERLVDQNASVDFKIQIRENYFLVYESNVNQVGLLPNKLPYEVARFYTYAKSLTEDVAIYPEPNYPPHIASFENLLETRDMLSELIDFGSRLVKQLQAIR